MEIIVTQSENDYDHTHFREFQKLGHGVSKKKNDLLSHGVK